MILVWTNTGFLFRGGRPSSRRMKLVIGKKLLIIINIFVRGVFYCLLSVLYSDAASS